MSKPIFHGVLCAFLLLTKVTLAKQQIFQSTFAIKTSQLHLSTGITEKKGLYSTPIGRGFPGHSSDLNINRKTVQKLSFSEAKVINRFVKDNKVRNSE